MALPSFATLSLNLADGVLSIVLNRPEKKNAFSGEMYDSVINALEWASTHPAIIVVVISGSGSYFSSGNDLTNFSNMDSDKETLAAASAVRLINFTRAFLQFPKFLILAYNGPAIGIAVTICGLADCCYASDFATFSTPFLKLGQSPEGLSSAIFPILMGSSKANEMLLMGKILSAAEAERANLVSEVIPSNGFMKEVLRRAMDFATMPANAIKDCKALIRRNRGLPLESAMFNEVDLLRQRWVSEECAEAVMKFMLRRSEAPKSKL